MSQSVAPITPFDFDPRTRVVFGAGSVARLGELAAELNGRKALVVTDRGIRGAGHVRRACASLEAAGLSAVVIDEVQANPTTEDVDAGVRVAREHDIDLIIGLGGGSSMDCAKGINFLLTNGGKMEDYWGVGKAKLPMLPMIAVPTTSGTGSEAQSFALIANAETHMKMACGDKKAACRVAILDPELTISMPAAVTMATGIDAMSHAIETYVTKPRNTVSQMYGRHAWGLIAKSFRRVFDRPDELDGRAGMLLGAHFAGAAIENSMLGAAHALANPLTAHFNVTHGIAVGVMLPFVIRFNAAVVGPLYGDLAADAGLCAANDPSAADHLEAFVTELLRMAGAPTDLQACGVDPELFDQMAEEASRQWTGTFNPRPVDSASLKELYQCAFDDRTLAATA